MLKVMEHEVLNSYIFLSPRPKKNASPFFMFDKWMQMFIKLSKIDYNIMKQL